MNIKGLFKELKSLRSNAQRTYASSAPGILTNRTTRGTTQMPLAKPTTGATKNASTIPRWG